jgi:hypothetical protein
VTEGDEDRVALEAVYWNADRHERVVLYEGPMELRRGGSEPTEMMGSVTYDFLPRPRVRFSAVASVPAGSASLGSAGNDAEDQISLSGMTGQPSCQVLTTSSVERGGGLSLTLTGVVLDQLGSGNGSGLSELKFNVINLGDHIGRGITDGKGCWWAGRVVLTGGSWEIRLDARKRLGKLVSDLRATGGFAFTHVGLLRRIDASPFEAGAAEEVLAALMYLLSFAQGMLVGVVLPVGYDHQGRQTWRTWSSAIVDPWRGALTWFDANHTESLEVLFAPVLKRWQDRSWHGQLRDLVRFYVEANDPNPLEKAVVMSQVGLELLAWAVLTREAGWSNRRAESLGATGRLRELLKWAGVPSDVPALLPDLSESTDGPAMITRARNEIVHPKGTDSPANLYDVWRLSQWYLELGILRLLGYQGQYANRLLFRSVRGIVEPVPWTSSSPSAPPQPDLS